MTEPKIIKKYPNRCLYDTSQSKYISLSDLKQFVLDDIPFEVREAKTRKDITRQVLLQIIADEENEGTPLFTADILIRFIRMYGDSAQGAFSGYLEQMSDLFDKQTRQFLEQFGEAPGISPMRAWTDMAKRNLETWQETQNNFFKATGLNPDKK